MVRDGSVWDSVEMVLWKSERQLFVFRQCAPARTLGMVRFDVRNHGIDEEGSDHADGELQVMAASRSRTSPTIRM
jgi:hypothetical protein